MSNEEKKWVDLDEIEQQVYYAIKELAHYAKLNRGDIMVLGCSSSEVLGNKIGSSSNTDIAESVIMVAHKVCSEDALFLAVQCCEHLNRAIVIERQCAERYGLEPVHVVPVSKAGGACAAEAYNRCIDPVVVEAIQGHAGLDIGNTLIGMHLKAVVVPVRLKTKRVGYAPVVAARTRPKFIGGPRAQYTDPNER